MGNPRNVGGIRARSGQARRRRLGTEEYRAPEAHYLTAREAGQIGRQQREKDEARGIDRRWNGRTTPEERERQRPRRRRLPPTS
jgi:hypothetical protein